MNTQDFIGLCFCILGFCIALALHTCGCSPQPTILRTTSNGQSGVAIPVEAYDGVITVEHAVDGDVQLDSVNGDRELVKTDDVIVNGHFAKINIHVVDGNKYPLCNYTPENGQTVTIYRWSGPAYWGADPMVVYDNRRIIAINNEYILVNGTLPAGSSGSPAISESGCIMGIVTSITPLGSTRLIRANEVMEFLANRGE